MHLDLQRIKVKKIPNGKRKAIVVYMDSSLKKTTSVYDRLAKQLIRWQQEARIHK